MIRSVCNSPAASGGGERVSRGDGRRNGEREMKSGWKLHAISGREKDKRKEESLQVTGSCREMRVPTVTCVHLSRDCLS